MLALSCASCPANQAEVAPQLQLLLNHLEFEVGAAEAISAVLQGNRALLEGRCAALLPHYVTVV